jgi:hypothetical protein
MQLPDPADPSPHTIRVAAKDCRIDLLRHMADSDRSSSLHSCAEPLLHICYDRYWPLAAYRAAELAIMSRNFSGPREPYAELRRAFVYKEKPPRTPPHLARRRTTRLWSSRPGRPSAQEVTTGLARASTT